MNSKIDRLGLLTNIFSEVNNWLKFAEAKNGALVAANMALLFGAARILTSQSGVSALIRDYIYLSMAFFMISLIISLLSFLPNLDLVFISKKKAISLNDNSFFFGSIYKYNKKEFLDLLNSKTKSSSTDELIELELDLSDQIVKNSKIAMNKYGLFSISLWALLTGLLTPIGACLVWLFKPNS